MDDVQRLADELKKRYSHVASVKDVPTWEYPALRVLDCVLSLNRRYDSFVVPRVEGFSKAHPEVRELHHLIKAMKRCSSPLEFFKIELDYDDEKRANTLRGVVEYLITQQALYQGSTELERLANWASCVTPKDGQSVPVYGFGLAGFQYLRMLFGVQTTKPDRHIKQFVTGVISRRVSDMTALLLMEKAARYAQLPLRQVDATIWRERSDATRQSSTHNQMCKITKERTKMPTLVINAPKATVISRDAKSFEDTFSTGIGVGYAIYPSLLDKVYDSLAEKVRQGCPVVLLSKDEKKRAEGMLVGLKRTNKTLNGIWRYDVHMEGLKRVVYKSEKVNYCGVTVIE